jgi:putative transposase
LYNRANYIVRQEFIENGKYLNASETQKLLQGNDENYLSLPSKVSQQVLRLLDKNWKSFFKSIEDWKKHPEKYKGRPKLPKYKDKIKGRNLVIYDAQAISRKELKKDKVKLSQTNISLDYQNKGNQVKQARIIFINQYQYVIEIVYVKESKEKKQNDNFIGIDLVLNNLCSIVSNKGDGFIIDGKSLKSMNQYYNKKKSKLMSYVKDKGISNRIIRLTNKRNSNINDYLHKTSKYIIDYCLTNDVSEIVIGYNKDWKQKVSIGKVNNQKFVSIPFSSLINKIKYKAELEGIDVILQEESYTSKCSFFDNEEVKKHDKYVGRRVKRGLFRTKDKKLINADINGALNILRKSNSQFTISSFERIEGIAVSPQRINPLK